MSKTIKTSEGNVIDMEALKMKNEKTIAVGNMRVNARGDLLSPTDGSVVKNRNERMKDYYKLHTTVPQDGPVPTSTKPKKDQ